MDMGLRARARITTVVAAVALVALPATAFARFGDHTLSTGSKGHDVRVLQSWLNKMGFTTGVAGEFGRHTRWSLRRFEQAKHLRVNGVLSPPDAAVMRRAMAAHYSFVSDDEPTTPQGGPGAKATMAPHGLPAPAPAGAPPQGPDAIAPPHKNIGKTYKDGGG